VPFNAQIGLMIRIKRGLDLPITGTPQQVIGSVQSARTVAILGRDYVGMKPTMAVKVDDRVRLGQVLFTDKKNPAVKYTAPGSGVVTAINRGHQRRLLSVVIELDGDDAVEFPSYNSTQLAELERQTIVDALVDSGMWTSLRTRPFSKVPDPAAKPAALFITAMDTNPLAANPELIYSAEGEAFLNGINTLAKLTEGQCYLCISGKSALPFAAGKLARNVSVQQFMGPHPAGLPGTHIHYLDPAGPNKQVWHINYQDVIAIAQFFATGVIATERIVALAGPQVREPRLVRTRIGANLEELVAGELLPHESRIVSGSVLAGDKAEGSEAYLGRYHLQISAVREGRERPLLGYLSPGANRHSVMGIYVSGLFKDRRFAMSTSTQGSERAMVPIGAYEKIMPLDILPTQLLRALIVGDIETALNLGALELDEEDLALCSYVCPGKYEYGAILRDNLTRIEKEG